MTLEKLTNMKEERLKTKPLPPPPPLPPLPINGSGNPNIEQLKSRDVDSDTDALRDDVRGEKNNGDQANEHERSEVSSPDNNRRYDRSSRDKDKDLKEEKDLAIDRFEKEAERERVRKERELRRKVEEAEREYEERLRDWEYREREKEKQRQYEKEREKEKERKRLKEILRDEEDEYDDSGKRWRRSIIEEKRRRRQREKEDDLADRLKEEEEIAEANKITEEERKLQHEKDAALKLQTADLMNGNENAASPDEMVAESKHKVSGQVEENGAYDVSTVPMAESEAQRESTNAATRKLGFGLAGSGKRAAVPSVFHEEDDDDAHKDKKRRPLVPLDYTTEELQAVEPPTSEAQPPNLAAAAEYAKQISNIAPKEEKSEGGRERSHRPHDRSGRREKHDEESYRSREEKVDREGGLDKAKTPDKQKLLNAKQLIDMIPKTKDELFSYEINWAIYDKHSLHDKMRPWISKKITEFLGEEEATLVDYVVSSMKEHVKAAQMLELLQSILGDEAEMFVLKMWRMLIFEIKKVETGLDLMSKS